MSPQEKTARWKEDDFEPDVIADRRWQAYVRRAFDVMTIAAFFVLIGVAALPMGANRDWAWAPLSVAFGLIAIVTAFGVGSQAGLSVVPGERRPLLGLVCCFAVFVAFALWQMSTFTPPAGDAWLFHRAAEILGSAHAAIPAVAADLARNSLLRVITCGLVFLIARAICRDRGNARWLLVAMAISAVLVVIYGLAMHVATHSCYVGSYLKKYGAYGSSTDFCLMSGTFVNSNSFACYVGMAITAVIALVFSRDDRITDSADGFERHHSGGFIDWLTGRRVALLAILLLLMGALLMSASRAGFAATVVSVMILGLLLMRGRWQSRPDLGRIFFIGLGAFVVVGAIAGGALVAKFGGSGELMSDGSRLGIWRASLEAVRLSPWLGWGLGGFPDAYRIVQPASILQANDLAHSTPLEVMVELGVLAVLPAWAIVLLPWAICLRGALRRRPSHRYLPIAAFSTAAVPILHSVVDFSLQMPAIAFEVSALLGMGWAQAFGRRPRKAERFAKAD